MERSTNNCLYSKHGMAQLITLRDFLESHKADNIWTHTSLAGGKYFISEDEMERFYDLYVNSILDQEKQYLTEKSTDIGPLRIDFDFIYTRDVDRHLHTKEQVLDFLKAYVKEVSNYLVLPENYTIYIMEKRRPTIDMKRNRIKSGIHIVIPEICTHKLVEQRVRRTLLKSMDTYFPNLPLT